MPRSVLVIAYFFPPTGGAGVQRTSKFVKYLPTCAWEPTVLTVANPSVPVFDATLSAEIPASVPVIKARTLEPDYKVKQAVSASAGQGSKSGGFKAWLRRLLRSASNMLLQPDPQILWLPAAYRAGRRLLKERKIDVIFVTAPPFSSLLIAALLSRRSGIPLVVDFRDEWDISNAVWENKFSNGFSSWIQGRMQRFVLSRADAVVATTEMSAATLTAKLKALRKPITASCIFNGYDPDDFRHIGRLQPNSTGRFRLGYVGTLWNLTSIAPVVEALARLHREQPELTGRIELAIAGRVTADQKHLLEALRGTNVTLVVHDYLDHPAALNLMRSSHALLMLLGDYEFAGRVVPAKTFEYLATGNRILAVAPRGEVWKILAEFAHAECIDPADTAALAAAIARQVREFSRGERVALQMDAVAKYSRPSLTARLAGIFDDLSRRDLA